MRSASGAAYRLRVAIAAALVAVTQSGCTLFLVGGAAGGGYYVGQDDRSLGRIVDDASITSSIKTRFVRDPHVDALDINVDTRNGMVTLHGHVPDAGVAGRAVSLARSVKGVSAVESRLSVLPSR